MFFLWSELHKVNYVPQYRKCQSFPFIIIITTTTMASPPPPASQPPGPSMPLLAPLGPAPDEAVYTDLKAVKAALNKHACDHGYGIGVASSRDQRAYYKCAKGGKYDDRGKVSTVHPTKQRRNTGTMKTDCPWRAVATKCASGYKVEVVNNNHNHGAFSDPSVLPQFRVGAISSEERENIKKLRSQGLTAKQILNSILSENPTSHLVPRDIYNLLASLQVEELDKNTPTE
jgi:hypothetical protein